jgi:hypothetical protein
MSDRKSRWNMIVYTIVILPILYWASAVPTLWVGDQYEKMLYPPYSGPLIDVSPEWWCTIYAPVLWAADQPTLGPITMKPFEWLDVDGQVEEELFLRSYHETTSISQPIRPYVR